jgi:hypothetical protein
VQTAGIDTDQIFGSAGFLVCPKNIAAEPILGVTRHQVTGTAATLQRSPGSHRGFFYFGVAPKPIGPAQPLNPM